MNLNLVTDLSLIIQDITLILKGFYLLGLFMYMIFAVVVIRQVDLMLSSLPGLLSLPVKPIAWLHFLLTLVVFLAAVVLL